ncbi:thioesterase II family protein [Lentzea sp. NPDC058436]|uniref:thioesterase II family protein n=1 Tax=Lentzea sp. NPDC058436 TaxID=3346499 RepID=UPI003659F26F
MTAWTAPLRVTALPARARLVVFPHAGAGPGAYLPLLRDLPRHVEVRGVTLPGHERRRGEPAGTTASDAVARITAELAALRRIPTVFFGHSLGGTLALACAAQCDALVVSGSVPPSTSRVPRADLSEEDLALALELLTEHRRTVAAVPLTALVGAEDPVVPVELVSSWENHTRARFRPVVLRGGHFFPFVPARREEVCREIEHAVLAAV